MKPISIKAVLGLLISLVVLSCGPKDDPPNPFDDPDLQPPDETVDQFAFDPNTFEGIHNNVFLATCANSGCHDGSFEPDFRSIEAAYNTLVFAPIIKNDPQGSFNYRVEPGDAEGSVLYHRLLEDIDGQSGIMPLAVNPDSDWLENKNSYITNIRNWIEAGAPDVTGNLPIAGNQLPQLLGVLGYAGGNTTELDREPGLGPIKVPAGTTDLEMWFALSDAETSTPDIRHNKAKISADINDFGGVPTFDLDIMPSFGALGYLGDQVDYFHRLELDVSSYTTGTTLFVRLYVQDDGPTITEIPTQGSATYIKEYVAIVIE